MLLPHQTLFYMLFMERQKSKNRSVTDFKLKRPLSSALRPKYFCICFDHHNQIKIRLNNYFKALPWTKILTAVALSRTIWSADFIMGSVTVWS